MFLKRGLVSYVLISALSLGAAVPALAQTYNGGLRGVVQDPSGALVTNARVTLSDDATHQVRETQTDGAGLYVFNALRPATYSLHVSAGSFTAADRTDIKVATQDFLTLDVQLGVGSSRRCG